MAGLLRGVCIYVKAVEVLTKFRYPCKDGARHNQTEDLRSVHFSLIEVQNVAYIFLPLALGPTNMG